MAMYEELLLKTEHNKIEFAKCMQQEYMKQLKHFDIDRNSNNMITITMCIRDSWRWINEIGIVAIQNNDSLLKEINELKDTQKHNELAQSEWEQYCNELTKANANLKLENSELKNSISNLKQLYDALCNEYKIVENENATLSNTLHYFQTQYEDTQSKMKECEQQMINLNKNVTYLKKERDSMFKLQNDTIRRINAEHKQRTDEMEIIISNLLKEKSLFSCEGSQLPSNDEYCAMHEFKSKLQNLFVKYELMNESMDSSNAMIDLKATLAIIENLCENSDKFTQMQTIKKSQKQYKRNILKPIKRASDELLSLMRYLQIVQNKNQYQYCMSKIKSLSSSLQHLATETMSPLLQNTVNLLNLLRNKMYKNANIYRYNNNLLHSTINKTKNKISELYKHSSIIAKAKVSQSTVISRRKTSMTELFGDIMTNQFEGIPVVTGIKTDKRKHNKILKIVICYNGKKYYRKLADFEWLSKAISLRGLENEAIFLPKLQMISLWDEQYLKKTKISLNAFLKDCHCTQWIRQFDCYNQTLFAKCANEFHNKYD